MVEEMEGRIRIVLLVYGTHATCEGVSCYVKLHCFYVDLL